MLRKNLKRLFSLVTTVTLLLAVWSYSEPLPEKNLEQGKVQWYTDFDEALFAAKNQTKPVMLEFFFPS